MAVSAMYLVAVLGIFGSITGSVNRLADGIAGIAALEVSGITDAGFPDTIAADVAKAPGVAIAAPMIRMSAPTTSGAVLLFGADQSSAKLGGALKDAVTRPVEQLSQTYPVKCSRITSIGRSGLTNRYDQGKSNHHCTSVPPAGDRPRFAFADDQERGVLVGYGRK